MKRALEINPNSVEANYEFGSMLLSRVSMPILVARTQSGVKRGQAGRIEDAAVRKRLVAL